MLQKKPVYGLAATWRLLFFAILGTTMGTFLDALHVWSGTASYQNVAIIPRLNVAWYVPLEFAVAGMVVGTLRPELDEELKRRRSDLASWKAIVGIVLFGGVWAASGLLGRLRVSNTMITVILLFVAVLGWYFLDRTRQATIAAVLTAFAGVGVESAIAYTGTYCYARPDFFGVPIWLPSLYLTACIAIGNLGRYLKYSWDRPDDEDDGSGLFQTTKIAHPRPQPK